MQDAEKRIAVTGGIGAGKSYVCRLLQHYGIAVYDSDTAAKRLMAESESLRKSLQALVGNDVYKDNVLQKAVLAQFILNSESNKQAVNNIVHPAVADDFLASGLHWLESAILFDSGFYHRVSFDAVVVVTAPLAVRLRRIVQRDSISPSRALAWVNKQWPQEELIRRADFQIVNDGCRNLIPQIEQVLRQL